MKLLLLKTYGRLIRLIRLNSGLNRLAFNPVIDRLFRGLDGPLTARGPGGFEVEIDPQDFNGRKLWLFGTNDWKINRTVNALLAPGDVLLDIGANLGTVGLDAVARVGPTGHVHLFEPQPDLARRLRTAVERRGAPNVTVHSVALLDRDGEMTLETRAGHTGRASLTTDGANGDMVVPLRDAAEYLRPLVTGRKFGIKIDVEGAEPAILRRILDFEGLKFVVFEGNSNAQVLFDMFKAQGFSLFGLERTLLHPRVRPVSDFEAWGDFHDFVAIRPKGKPPTASAPLERLRRIV